MRAQRAQAHTMTFSIRRCISIRCQASHLYQSTFCVSVRVRSKRLEQRICNGFHMAYINISFSFALIHSFGYLLAEIAMINSALERKQRHAQRAQAHNKMLTCYLDSTRRTRPHIARMHKIPHPPRLLVLAGFLLVPVGHHSDDNMPYKNTRN